MKQEELQQTPSFRYKERILPLINVLDDLYGITFFHFGRIHKKLGKITLGNSLDFAPRYWSEYAEFDSTFWPERIEGLEIMFYDGKNAITKQEKRMFEERAKKYNISEQGVILIRHYDDYVDTFNFSSIRYQVDKINPLLRKLPKLNLYCDFFLKEIADILADTSNYTKTNYKKELPTAIVTQKSYLVRTDDDSKTENPIYKNAYTNKFITQRLNPLHDIALTDMEALCLYWAAEGKTADETALILNKSRRTVEGHLLAVRNKLDCSKTSAAIIKAEKIGILRNGKVYSHPSKTLGI